MKDKIVNIVSDKRIIISIFLLLAVFASIQSLTGTTTFFEGGIEYNKCNNYTIFEKSFQHLKNNQDLYILYPEEHWDLYKYTPSFSVLFGIFSVLPDWLGLTLWNILNAMVFLAAVYYLPKLNNYQKGLILLIVIVELITSIQNEQSNALIAGLLILAYGFLEKNKAFWATLCIVFSVFIKLFGIVGFALFLFYPNKWKSVLYTLFWTGVLLLLPLIFVSVDQYIKLYSSFINMLKNDHDISYGYSVMGWIHSWFSAVINKNIIVLTGVLVFLIPFVRIKLYKESMFTYLVLCSILIWIVIFNHKAESPTFIIAMAGVALWFVRSEKNTLNIILFVLAFILTSLSPTDLFPEYLRDEFVHPYSLKAFPCVLIWCKIIYDMMALKSENQVNPLTGQPN
ncbi:MAG: DUF2029 domain-containing protein [Saprospiraceae bacterium]|nr:DUF2029 domain-containing protein [Saprospiraceae bacterium]